MTMEAGWDGKPKDNRPDNWKVDQTPVNTLRVCAISDIHEKWNAIGIPKADLLVVAGDITFNGDYGKVSEFNNWCYGLKDRGTVKEIVTIAGNHDITAESDRATWRNLLHDVVYLADELYEWRGLRIYGSPWSPTFGYGWAFNADRGAVIRRIWSKIPENLDILITHGPPYGVGDRTARGEYVGCKDLLDALDEKHPRIHVFGHIHEGYGMHQYSNTLCLNASICTLQYKPTNPPLVIDLTI